MPHGIIINIGDKFARLTVLAPLGKDDAWKSIWLCRCDCGALTQARTAQLSSGLKQSCGCIVRENAINRNLKHGMTVRGMHAPEYDTFTHVKDRCYNPNCPSFDRYGGRGIKVCAAFLADFMNFYNCVGPRPTPTHSIDRIDNDGHYSCGLCDECIEYGWLLNVKWATKKEQSQNRSITHWITFEGQTLCLAEWSKISGIAANTLRGRLKAEWPVRLALTIPASKLNRLNQIWIKGHP